MTSNLYNKAIKNIKIKDNANKVSCTENEISENLKKAFAFELKNLIKSIELKKLIPTKLYEFLIKYENNLPTVYFYRHVMTLGATLISSSYPMIAKHQCYERYLITVRQLNLEAAKLDIEGVLSALEHDDDFELTVSAILGATFAEFESIRQIDTELASEKHQQMCRASLRRCATAIGATVKSGERYCWLLHNGTVTVYAICRQLIRCGHSILAVEPLIWASCALESSIPLLTIPNLKWRTTIYTAVCEALYNIESDMEAEAFARRGLLKISELHEIYQMSSGSTSLENALAIREATIKMGVMIFKRNVFETRRRPKSYLRPKTKVNFKDILQGNWPRTGTERILEEMFENPSQQILAIVESMKQPSRTIGKIEPPAAENEWEMLDVYSELFHAAVALITGKSIGKSDKRAIQEFRVLDTEPGVDQLTLATNNGKETTIDTAFQLVCWGFSYGNWTFLTSMLDPLLGLLKDSKHVRNKTAMENTLHLFSLMSKAVQSSNVQEKKPPNPSTEDDKTKAKEVPSNSQNKPRSVSTNSKETKSSKSKRENSSVDVAETDIKQSQDPLSQLVEFINHILDNDFEPSQYYQEILTEAGCILWNKCKSIFQATQDGSLVNQKHKPISRIGKWIRILYAAYRVLSVTQYAEINPISYSDLSIQMALLLEKLSINGGFFVENDNDDEYPLSTFISSLKSSRVSKSERCITAAKDVLVVSIAQMNRSRKVESLNKISKTLSDEKSRLGYNSSDDLFLELNTIFLRICARELVIYSYVIANENIKIADIRKSDLYKNALQFCNKNLILLAIFQAHLVNLLKNNLSMSEIQDLVQNIRSLLEKSEHNLSDTKMNRTGKELHDNDERLPSPIVTKKGNDFIEVILNSNLSEAMKSKIGWVRLYARPIDTPNAEVRLTDDKFPGTGVETSCLSSIFTIYQLNANEQYLLAFAAFDKFGSPIGRGMGYSTKKILAIDSINRMSAISTIAQILFEIGFKEEIIEYERVLWTYFIEPEPECKGLYQVTKYPQSQVHNDYKIKGDLLNCCSPLLLRQFCLLVLSSVDCECRLRNITNDISHKSPSQIQDQVHRLNLSDKLLALFPISKKLKDHFMTIEIFASICCLMVPIINHNQLYQPFSEVLIICVNTLHGLPQNIWIRISPSLKLQVHQLIASVGFYLLKSFTKCHPGTELYDSTIHSVTNLLQMSGNAPFAMTDQGDGASLSANTSRLEENNDKIQTNVQKKTTKPNKADVLTSSLSPQHLAFESFKFSLAKQSLTDHQLSGTEEPDILMAYITHLPSRIAYKEVLKFSKKARYLQFIVEILHRAMVEGNYEQCINYQKEIRDWIKKRNETILGRPVPILQSHANPAGMGDKELHTRPTRMEDNIEDFKKPSKQKKKTKYKALKVDPSMSDIQKQIQEQAEIKALEIISVTFCPLYKQNQKRRRFRQISDYERPSRIKMNCSMAMSYVGIGLSKVDVLTQILNAGLRFAEVMEIEDVAKFMLDGTGIILSLDDIALFEENREVLKTTKHQSPRQSDTPRTYRSEMNYSDKRLIAEVPKLINQFSDSINKVVSFLTKAVVLAGRGRHWILLSKACSLVWYSLAIFVNVSHKLSKFINLAKSEAVDIDWRNIQLMNLKAVMKVFSPLMFWASDGLLDIMEELSTSACPNSSSKSFDHNFMHSFILRSLHVLSESQSYEKSIHIILRFTKLTNFEFVNVTHPILIGSQQQLSKKAKDHQERNPDWTQAMCQQYITQSLSLLNWDHMDSSNYDEFLNKRRTGTMGQVTLIQSKLKILPDIEKLGNKESHVRNLLPMLKSKNECLILFSVPVDFEFSHKEWERYGQIRTARKLWLELSYKRNHIYFLRKSGHKQTDPPKPTFHDLLNSYEEFLNESTSGNKTDYYPLILRDMGDFYNEYLQRPDLALPLWNEGLDAIFNKKQSSKSLKDLLYSENGEPIKYTYQTEKLTSKFGITTCLVIGSLLVRISKTYGMSGDDRINQLLQAAMFYKAIYSASLVHPREDLKYLSHSSLLDLTSHTPLSPKLFLFSSYSIIDSQDIESHLYFVITNLIQAGYYQFTIPLVAFYEHIVYAVCRSSTKCIEVQLMKLEICIRLRQFSSASGILLQLFTGDKIAQQCDSQPAPTFSKTPVNLYNDRQHVYEEMNLTVLDKIMSRRINPAFAQKLGPSLSNKISLLQAEFLTELSSCIPGAPEIRSQRNYNSSDNSSSPKKQTLRKSETLGLISEDENYSVLENLSSTLQYSSWKEIDLPILKGLMLQVSSNIVQPIIDDFLSSIQREELCSFRMTPSEVERDLYGLFVQSKNCRYRGCNRSGARLAMFGCKLLQDYYVDPIPRDTKSVRTFANLDVFTHMRLNREMVKCLLGEISLGNNLDLSETAVPDVPNLKDLIMSSIADCDEYGLLQLKAWFIAALAQYVFMSGYDVDKYQKILQESLAILDGLNMLSDESENVLMETRLRLLNVQLTIDNGSVYLSRTTQMESELRDLHKRALANIDARYPQSVSWNIGDTDQSHLEISNVYDKQYIVLCKMKLLLAAFTIGKGRFINDKSAQRVKALEILNSGLELCRSISFRQYWVETECLLMIGRIQRYLLKTKEIPPSSAISPLVEGIKLSVLSSGHLGIKKQFFLELSLTFMACSRLCSSSFNDDGEIVDVAKLQMTPKFTEGLQNQKTFSKGDALHFRKLAWLAIKCAQKVSDCMQELNILKSDSSRTISKDAKDNLPVSVLFDLYGRYKLGNPRIVFKSELEEELSRMPEARIQRDSEQLDDQIERIENSVTAISLSQILSYQEVLLKFSNNQFLNKSEDEERFRMQFLTRYIFNSDFIFERESQLYQYLTRHIPEYHTKCTVPIPREMLVFCSRKTPEDLQDDETLPKTVSIEAVETAEEQENQISVTINYPKGVLGYQEIVDALPVEKMDVNETEIYFQFYDSAFEFSLHGQQKSLLMYGCTKKLGQSANKLDAILTGWIIVSSKEFLEVHRDIQESAQLLEVLSSKYDTSSVSSGSRKSSVNISNTGNPRMSKGNVQQSNFAGGSEISGIELKIRQAFDKMIMWVPVLSDMSFAPPKEILVKNSENSFTISPPGIILNSIPFDLTKEKVRLLANSLNPIISQPIRNSPLISKFIQGILKIEF